MADDQRNNEDDWRRAQVPSSSSTRWSPPALLRAATPTSPWVPPQILGGPPPAPPPSPDIIEPVQFFTDEEGREGLLAPNNEPIFDDEIFLTQANEIRPDANKENLENVGLPADRRRPL